MHLKLLKKLKGNNMNDVKIIKAAEINYTPKVSVIIPVYNVEPYLRQCLDSVINQTLKDIEIICVDDGSTDNSLSILKEYAQIDNRITVLSRKNIGVGFSRNEGIDLASGNYIAFMDPDDFYPNNKVLELMWSNAVKHKAKICGGSLLIYNDKNGKLLPKNDRFNLFKNNEMIYYSDYQYDYGFQKFIYETSFIRENKIYFPYYKRFQDPPFMIKAFILAKKFYAIKDEVYCYRYSHKQIQWTQEKISHLLHGLLDDLCMADEYNLNDLFSLTINHLKKDYKQVIAQDQSSEVKELKNEIMKICLEHTQNLFHQKINNAKVSIVMPIYNAEPYLRECLDSVINQTLKNIEIICVNDGSTDNSLEIIKEYAQKDVRIKYIDKPNAGYGQTMNCGIAAASGEYIGIVEPDDFVKPEMYETLYNKAKELDLDIVKADYFWFTNAGSSYIYTYNNVFPDKSYYHRILSPENDEKILCFISMNASGIFRRDFLEKNNICHNETPGASYQDNGFYVQTMYMASRIYFLAQPFYCYRRDNPNSSINQSNKVHAIPEEFKFIDTIFNKNEKLQKFIQVYTYYKYMTFRWYLFTLLAPEFWEEYINYCSNIFKQCQERGEICSQYFSQSQIAELSLLINEPQKFRDLVSTHYEQKLRLKKQIFVSYKILSCIPIFSVQHKDEKSIYKILGISILKIKRKYSNKTKTTRYYLFGLPFVQIQQ